MLVSGVSFYTIFRFCLLEGDLTNLEDSLTYGEAGASGNHMEKEPQKPHPKFKK